MAEYFTVNLHGAKELNDVLKKLPGVLQQKVYMQSLRKGAVILRDRAKESAPYGTDFQRRSYLKRSKKGDRTVLVKLRDQIKITVITKTDISFQLAIHVGAAYWGMFQEYGTANQPAQPWLRPAFDSKAEEALNTVGKALGEGVEKAAERLAGSSLSKTGLLRRR